MTHDDLARSLADHLRSSDRMVWCDVQMGPSGSPRPDVYAVFKSYKRPSPISYECKVSFADYKGDVTSGKWMSYLEFSAGVYFACEDGLLSKDCIPDHCGLIRLKNGAWKTVKRATLGVVTIPQHVLLKLLIDGVEREGPRYRARWWDESRALHSIEKKFGPLVAQTLRDRMAVEREIEYHKFEGDRIVKRAQERADSILNDARQSMEPQRQELRRVLQLPEDATSFQIEQEVRRIRQAVREHPETTRLQRLTNALRYALDVHGYKEAPCSTSSPVSDEE